LCWPREADGLEVNLVELAEAAFLGLFVAEHRALAPELETRTAQQAIGDRRPHDAGGGLGTKREAVAALVGEGVHLLFDHVGVFADGALEELRLLDHRHADFFVAVGIHDGAGGSFHVLPQTDVGGKDVFHAGDRLDIAAHRCAEVVSGPARASPRD